jgi:hypothetical protein
MICKRNESWYKPNVIIGAGVVTNILLFDSKGVWYESRSGWLEHFDTPNSSSDVHEICGDEPRRANKVKFDRTYPFYKIEKQPFSDKRGYSLYIPIARVECETVTKWQNDNEVCQSDQYEVDLPCKYESVQLRDDHEEQPQGRKTERIIVESNTVTLQQNYTRTNTKRGSRLEKLAASLSEVMGIELCRTHIEELEEKYTLQAK